MSTIEMVRQVKAMSRRQRDRVLVTLLAMDQEGIEATNKARKKVQWPNVEARARRVFGDRMMPNLVLLEREESSC